MTISLPEYCHPLDADERFSFACHRGVPCFTECCRQLDLFLSPYDVLRLKNRLGMHSSQFLEQYVIIEADARNAFPGCYLTMVDDGRASCVFVSSAGCTVYDDRPGACRCYPVGRGASRTSDGRVEERFVLLREGHCQGFQQDCEQDVATYLQEQGLEPYNYFNDALMELLQHERLEQGFLPNHQQRELFILALYNLDQFRQELKEGKIQVPQSLTVSDADLLSMSDEDLLLLAIRFLLQAFFSD